MTVQCPLCRGFTKIPKRCTIHIIYMMFSDEQRKNVNRIPKMSSVYSDHTDSTPTNNQYSLLEIKKKKNTKSSSV